MSTQIVTAHSGCEGTETDSLESIEKALIYKADAIEIDIRRAQNGDLRLTHNQLTEEEYLTKARLEDAFDRIKDTDLLVNCDIKEPAVLYYLLDKAAEFGLGKDRLIITGCTSAEQLIRDPHLNDKAQVYANVEQLLKYDYLISHPFSDLKQFLLNLDEPLGDVKYKFQMTAEVTEKLISYCRILGVAGLNLPHFIFNEQFAEMMNDAKVPFSIWTVNDPELAKRLFENNAANITTRAVKDIVKVKNAISERRLSDG